VTSALFLPPTSDPFSDLAGALGDVQRFLDDLARQANAVLAWVKKMEDALRPDLAFCKTNPNNDLCKLVPPDLSFCDKNPNNEGCKLLRGPLGGGFPIP
jgi:hypothetical protein